jgi:hypothetical protein
VRVPVGEYTKVVANALSVGARDFKKIVPQFRQFLAKLHVGRRIEPARANKPVEKPHAFLTCTAAPPRQADSYLSPQWPHPSRKKNLTWWYHEDPLYLAVVFEISAAIRNCGKPT